MYVVRNDSHDPYYNLALEEYLFREFPEDCIMLWQNSPAVIVGRFQNTPEEVNLPFLRENSIPVVRRITGGGAVYHDLGNLNFTFIEKNTTGKIDMERFSRRIAGALNQLGFAVQAAGRNDLIIDGRKVSGAAQHQTKERVLHHGTLLYQVNMENLAASLNVKAAKISSKGVASVRSRVANLVEYAAAPQPIPELAGSLAELLTNGQGENYFLSEQELNKVEKICGEKYRLREWNFGRSPAYNLMKIGRLSCGMVECYLQLEAGIIQNCRIFGDFFSTLPIEELEQELVGLQFNRQALAAKLSEAKLRVHLGDITLREFNDLLFQS